MATGGLKAIVENAGGALLIAGCLLTPFLRSWRTRWGATDEEVHRSLPGDDLVPHPRWQWTHAVTIEARASDVWPWLAQMGQGRGGFYSYELLENLAGCRIHNADRIVPEWQHLNVGDDVRLHPTSPALPVAVVEPDRVLVLHAGGRSPAVSASESAAAGPGDYVAVSWTWFLEPVDERATRLISRWRAGYRPSLANRLGYGPLIVEPIGFAMSRKMLLGIKQRAEAARGAPAEP